MIKQEMSILKFEKKPESPSTQMKTYVKHYRLSSKENLSQ